MSHSNTYEGWLGFGDRSSAYATWNLVLWVDNDYGLHRLRVDTRKELQLGAWTANAVRAFAEAIFPAGTPDMTYGDMDKVNYGEIAQHWNSE